jgi:hypothetical protein
MRNFVQELACPKDANLGLDKEKSMPPYEFEGKVSPDLIIRRYIDAYDRSILIAIRSFLTGEMTTYWI